MTGQRITVSLPERTVSALRMAAELTGDSKTDVVNRAIRVYAYLEQLAADGGTIYVRESGKDELKQVKFL